MAQTARERLSEAMELFGDEGRLMVYRAADDPLGTTAEGADPAPHSGIEAPRSKLSEAVARANAQSRGEVL
ncbi:hypothetical protein [Streptomyces sp. NPDC048489]|uniref:hypothetical protein n=1 Tax=Streptomyces sp. NPDC048489 TaxID=3154504 RepID=UPI00344986FD